MLFLEERFIAIRCEFFIQGIISPREILKLIKGMLLVDILRGFNSGNRPLVGLELLVQEESIPIMEADFLEEYKEALKCSIISAKQK